MNQPITELYAFVQPDAQGCESLVVLNNCGTSTPLIATDLAHVAPLRLLAYRVAELSGQPVQLVHFVTREPVDVIAPVPWPAKG